MTRLVNQTLRRATAAMEIPTLETERLTLRGYAMEDAADVALIQGDAETMRYLGGKTDATLQGAFRMICAHTAGWHFFGFGKWAVEEKASGRVIGRVGYLDSPYDWPGLELGWTIARDRWGQGFASEGAKAARDWGFETLGAARIISMIDPANAASMAVAAKVGATRWRDFEHEGVTQTLWSITRDEWEARR